MTWVIEVSVAWKHLNTIFMFRIFFTQQKKANFVPDQTEISHS